VSGSPLHFEVTGPAESWTLSRTGRGPFWVGRDDDCDVRLAVPNVSRRHVSVERTGAGLRFTDTSSNGTLVNGTRLLKSSCVVDGCRGTLQVGTFQVRLWGESSVRPKSKAPAAKPPEKKKEEEEPQKPDPPPAGPSIETRRAIHRKLLQHLDLGNLDLRKIDPQTMRPKVASALRRIVAELGPLAPPEAEREALVQELADETLGLGPLERLLADSDVSEIMVVDPLSIFVEKKGRLTLTGLRFTDDDSVRAVIERIVTPLGRRIDESAPLVDARLRDGSRVNAVIPPLALKGPCITIRKFSKTPLAMNDLVKFDSLTADMARFLAGAVQIKKNVVISGGTGSGKTTLLNVLSAAIPEHERVVTVEDAAELRLAQRHVVSLEARPANLEGKGEYSIRDLVKNALRMRPDRIVVGECRGGEAIDMLQAMNTGHEGSLTTTHANSPREAVARIETLCLMAGLDLPVQAIRRQIASSIHLIVQQARLSDGARKVTSITEVVGLGDDGEVELREIFSFKVKRTLADGKLEGTFLATGYLPSFLDEFLAHGFADVGVVS
jgi:pilus assembly protein CpaF